MRMRPRRVALPYAAFLTVIVLIAFAARPALQERPACLTSDELARALADAIRAARFGDTEDFGQNDGRPVAELPSLDLSVVAFPRGCAPAYANVLFSRDMPDGHRARIDPVSFDVTDVRWVRDRVDPVTGESILWQKGADWSELALQDLVEGRTGARFVVPYPASSVKVLPAIGVLRLVDQGTVSLDDPLEHDGRTESVMTWLDEMITVSSNEATFALTRLLHDHGEIEAEEPAGQEALPCTERTERRETRNAIHDALDGVGLVTLRYGRTRPCDGSFFNSARSGVGHHHMTSWDAVRLLWLLDPAAPTPTWNVRGRPVSAGLLSDASRRLLVSRLLGQQALHEALSTTVTCGKPGRVEGIPARLPDRWFTSPAEGDYSVRIGELRMSNDARPCNSAADVTFAHKTGLTENYGSNFGIVRGLEATGARRHYLIGLFTNLGSRYARDCETGGLCYTQRIPALGKAIDEFLTAKLEP